MFIEEIFSTRTQVKVLRTISEQHTAYSLEELMLKTTLSRGSVHKSVSLFKKLGIVEVVRGKGKREFYKLNSNSPFYHAIIELFEKENLFMKLVPSHIWNGLERFTDDLSKKIKSIEKIYLFGSVARGNYTPQSDIDVLVIVDSIDEAGRILIKKIFSEYFKSGSVLIEKKDAWEKHASEKTKLYQEISKEAIELWKAK